jgi:hypothetical protein
VSPGLNLVALPRRSGRFPRPMAPQPCPASLTTITSAISPLGEKDAVHGPRCYVATTGLTSATPAVVMRRLPFRYNGFAPAHKQIFGRFGGACSSPPESRTTAPRGHVFLNVGVKTCPQPSAKSTPRAGRTTDPPSAARAGPSTGTARTAVGSSSTYESPTRPHFLRRRVLGRRGEPGRATIGA